MSSSPPTMSAPAATPPVVLVMLEAVRDFYEMTQVRIGVKPAGGIRNTKDAIKQLVVYHIINGFILIWMI